MIMLYSGTPGSGKSLHMAERIFTNLFMGRPVIGNFEFNDNLIKFKRSNYQYISNDNLNPQYLKDYSIQYQMEHGSVREGYLKLFIDEAQLLFNSRDYSRRDRKDWLSFFSLHRHFKYDIVLACQFDRMLDRQIRCLIEYEFIHRKLSNFGWRGVLLDLIMLGNMFCSVKMWYPMHEKVGSEFFRFKKKYSKCYDTFQLDFDNKLARPLLTDGGKGDTQPETEEEQKEGGNEIPPI